MDNFDEKLAALDHQINPPNYLEFELGMFLQALVDIIEFKVEDFDPEELNDVVDGAVEALKMWTPKYQDFIDAVTEAKRNADK